jgi:hypothetical protein
VRIGPITIISTRKHDAYHHLANVTMVLHQTIWYGNVPFPVKLQGEIKAADAAVSDALSHVDPTA